ncbi:MAG TPA: hypothetical protein VKZ18_04460 [Polyangia bacterium]|nr:hypothetical protein [Polyangia bacterium]
MKRILLVVVALAVSTCLSCAHVIIDSPIPLRGDGWELTLKRLTDGPNSFGVGNTVYHPGDGERFIWAHVTLHNPANAPRKFSFDRCDLDAGNEGVVPAMVSFAFLNGDVNREPELAADETIDRRLIFSYPMHQSPTRLRCAPMTVALPQF